MGSLKGQVCCLDSLLHPAASCSQSRLLDNGAGAASPFQPLHGSGNRICVLRKEGRRRDFHAGQKKRLHLACRALASNGAPFQQRASELTEEAKRKAKETAQAFSQNASKVLENIRRTTLEFERKNDLRGRARGVAKAAGQRIDEVADDIRRQASSLDSQYGVSEKAKQAMDVARHQAERIDDEYKFRYKTRNAVKDFQRHWPSYRRRLSTFSQTFVGKALMTLFFFYMVISGWGITFLFYSLWLGPIIFPFILKLAGNNVVRGACNKCGTPFLGVRGRMIICQRCQTVVQRQYDEGSGGGGNDDTARIIDIDPQ